MGERGGKFTQLASSRSHFLPARCGAAWTRSEQTALLQSGILMLRYINERAAEQIEKALHQVLREGKVRTCDIGGTTHTTEYADAIIAAL